MALTRVHTDLIEGSLGGDASEELQVDTFTGDGTTVTFGLTRLPDHANNTQVYISGVYQQKDTYTVSGLDLTFSEAPAVGETIEAVVAYVNPMYSGDHVKKSGDTMTGDLTVDGDVYPKTSTSQAVYTLAALMRLISWIRMRKGLGCLGLLEGLPL